MSGKPFNLRSFFSRVPPMAQSAPDKPGFAGHAARGVPCFSGCLFTLIMSAGFCGASAAQPVQTLYNASGQLSPIDATNLPARAAAMGSAFVGVADDVSALAFNPAGLASLGRGEIALNSSIGWMGSFAETGLAGMPLGGWGGIGFSGSYLTYGSLEGRDESGTLTPDYGAETIGIQAGLGVKVLGGMSLGGSLRCSWQSIAGNTFSYFAPDAGILWEPVKGFKAGLDYVGAGWGSSSSSPLVSTLKDGLSWAGRMDSSMGLLMAVGSSFQTNSMDYIQGGVEVSYVSTCFLRAGYQAPLNDSGYAGLSRFSLGAGLGLKGFNLDYAFSPSGSLGNSHHFSVVYAFETKPQSSASFASPETSGKIAPIIGLANRPPNSHPSQFSMSPAFTAPGGGLENLGPPPEEIIRIKPDKNAKKNQEVQFDIPPDLTAQGEALEAQGRYSEAIPLFQEALQQDPQNIQALWDMGEAYFLSGNKANAVDCFDKVLKLQPESKNLREWLEKYKAQRP